MADTGDFLTVSLSILVGHFKSQTQKGRLHKADVAASKTYFEAFDKH